MGSTQTVTPLNYLLPQASSKEEHFYLDKKCHDCENICSSPVGTGQVVSQDKRAKTPYAVVLVRDVNCLWWVDLSWLPGSH